MLMDKKTEKLFKRLAEAMDALKEFREEHPELAELEGKVDDLKAQVSAWAKENNVTGEAHGVSVSLSERTSWDNKLLAGFMLAHPEIEEAKKITVVATVRRKP